MLLRISTVLLLAFCAVGQFAPPGKQTSFFDVSDRPAGPQLQFNAVVEPPLADPKDLKLGWGVFYVREFGHDVWHRFVYDTVHKEYFGYDLILGSPRVNLLTNQPIHNSSYLLSFAPLSLRPDQIEPKGLTLVALPKYPDPQTIWPGDEIVVDLLSSGPAGRRKVVDHIQIAPLVGLHPLKPFTKTITAFTAIGQTVRAIYEKFGRVAGIEISFDPASVDRLGEGTGPSNLELGDVSVPDALNAIAYATHTFWKPGTGNSIIVTKDVPRPTSTGPPKDYTIDDGPIKFDFIAEVLINGQKFEGKSFFQLLGRTGNTPWFSFPGQGRFILSLVPHAKFVRAGEIRDNAIAFHSGGVSYEITMNGPIVEGGGVWNLYLLHDASFQPGNATLAHFPAGLADTGKPFVIGDTDRLENLLPQ